ncbi:MAG: hypothetical protein P1U62_10995 [Alteraurantiacibacter sp. bin_em_oilr2.035]|nr:hypothetical protein [Aurantiacibacter atlanticus]MDF1835388.1 hypothetical protein [Alteraurantiacibacter sp. bin_em_oilr2.035]
MKNYAGLFLASIALAACQQGESSGVPGDTSDTQPYNGIAEETVLHIIGTEPFWRAQIADHSLTWSTPENVDGVTVPVERFAGRGGVSFSGQMDGAALDAAITPGACSDGMSDRTYPFTATIEIGKTQYRGCAWREGEDELGEP